LAAADGKNESGSKNENGKGGTLRGVWTRYIVTNRINTG